MSKAVSRLYNNFQPEQYDIRLDMDLHTNVATGTVIIRGKKVGRPSQRLTFHAKYLTINSATIVKHDKKQGQQEITVSRINIQKSYDEVRLHTADKLFAGQYTITMQFSAPLQSTMHGMYRSEYKLHDQLMSLISTQFESHHAREAFPCIDEPEAKACFNLSLSVPIVDGKSLTVVSNMPASSQLEEAGKLVSVFETSPRMSTYLLAFAVGDLQHKTVKTKDGVSVSVYATKAHKPAALDFALQTTQRCIEFFNDYYGVPYPLPKCDIVAIPDFSAAAMENWGLVTYREPYILADPETTPHSMREVIATVICHELSHQWFGDLVTMKWWDDLWLNESFANVMEYVGVDALFPDWQVFNTFVAQEGLAAFRRDSIYGVQSIKTEVRHPDEISTLFDPSIVYAKGGRLLNMLRTYIGENDFRAGLTKYFEKHQYGNTTGDDLWQALSASSGKDVAAFMNPWLQQPGFPVITVDQHAKKLSISQAHFLVDPSKADADRLWPVPLLATTTEIPAILESSSLTTTLQTGDYIRINQAAVGHYIVHYKNPDHSAWIADQVKTKLLSETERLILLSDSSLLARSGVISLADTMRLLEYYADDSSEPVWDIIAVTVADARRFVDSDPNLEDAIKTFLRKIIEHQYQRLGWDELPGESSHDTKLRATILGLGTYAEHETIKSHALELFETYKQDNAAVASELRGIVFAAAVRYAAPGAFEYLLDLEESTTNPNLKQELLGALSSSRSTGQGALLLERIKDSHKVRPHDIDHWLVLLMRNRYNQDQAWQWLRNNWSWIETTFAGDKTYDSFPRYAASAFSIRQRLQEYRDFFEPKVAQPVLTRNITMGIEELESRIAWIERDLASVQDYFKSSI